MQLAKVLLSLGPALALALLLQQHQDDYIRLNKPALDHQCVSMANGSHVFS